MVTTRHDTLGQRVAQIWKTSATKQVLGSDFSPLWKPAERMTNCLLRSKKAVRVCGYRSVGLFLAERLLFQEHVELQKLFITELLTTG